MVLEGFIMDNLHYGRCGGLARTKFGPFSLWDGKEILKVLILESSHFGRV